MDNGFFVGRRRYIRTHGQVVGSGAPSPIEVDACPEDAAAWAAFTTPGASVVGALARVQVSRLSPAGRIDLVSAIEKQIAWLQARQMAALAALAAQPYPDTSRGDLDKQWMREDVAAALHLSSGTAADRLALARELMRLPATMGLLGRGEITVHHARTLAEAVVALDDATAAAVEAQVVPAAPEQSPASFRRAVRKAVLTLTAAQAEERRAQALTERRVVFTPVADGMTELWALLPAEGAAAVKSRLDDAASRRDVTDPRTADQRRADALVELALTTCTHTSREDAMTGCDGKSGCGGGAGSSGKGGGRLRPTVQVTVALSTLLAMDEQPGVLDGHGPIPAALARRIAADESGTWKRLVTDELGRLLDYGRSSYRPPADLDDFVRARDATCRFPNCNRPARRTDLDHITPWADAGDTSAHNLQALCARHHALKHETPWQVRRNHHGTTEWTSPTGHQYLKPPAALPIDRTATPATSPPTGRTVESTDPGIDRTTKPPDDPDPPF